MKNFENDCVSENKKTPRNEENSDKLMELELELEEKKRKINSLEKALVLWFFFL